MKSEKLKVPSAARLPAPTLFVPPSLNSSMTSLLQPNATAPSPIKPSLSRQRSHRNDRSQNGDGGDFTIPTSSGRRAQQQQEQQSQQPTQQKPNITLQLSDERAEATWIEMQNTLDDIELSAMNPSNVFGPNHAKALDELRTAQIALAQAWARSEMSENTPDPDANADAASHTEEDNVLRATGLIPTDRLERTGAAGAAGTRQRTPSVRSDASDRSQLAEDTEKDIKLSRERRKANDLYFERVNAGVLDVVTKLDEVAKAMKIVEQESKEIWADNESITTASTVP